MSPHDYLSTLLLPLQRAGTLKELTAVLPYDNGLTQAHLDEARSFMEKGGISEGDRGSFHIENGAIHGAIAGMPVTLTSLTALERRESKGLLAVDTAFLPAMYRNEVKTPMVDLAWKLVLTLRERNVGAGTVVLFDAVGRPDFPLEYGFLASLLREMLSRPDAFAKGPPEKWRMLQAADAALFFAQFADGMALYREYLGKEPDDASACYKIATMGARDLDVGLVLHWLNRAVAIDSYYRRSFSDLAGYFFRKEQFDATERILQAGLSRYPKDPLLATNLSALYLNRGEAMREAGDPMAARELYLQAAGVDGADPPLRERAKKLSEPTSPPTPLRN